MCALQLALVMAHMILQRSTSLNVLTNIFTLFLLNAGLTTLVSLNVSNSHVTNEGLQYLKPLKNLRSLTLESCRVTTSEIKNLQLVALPNLVSFRPE